MGLLDVFGKMVKGRKRPSGEKQKCPNCGEPITLDMERCPKCAVRIKSMFRRKCPKCGTLNDLDVKKCKKCRYDFEAELERAKKTYYICPRCGYKHDVFLTRCPVCRTRFM